MKTINYKYNKLQIHVDKWGYLVFKVYKKTDLSSPWYRKFFKIQGKYDDIREIPGYIETIDSLKKNILPIQDPDNWICLDLRIMELKTAGRKKQKPQD